MTTTQTGTAAEAAERSQRKTLEGWVVSDKMDKTRTIRIVRRVRHSLYQKVLTRHTKVHAHDEKNESRTGDKVSLMEVRPMSKLKRWRIVSILEKGAITAGPEASK